jgi:type VI secretion system secreted protein VgrG
VTLDGDGVYIFQAATSLTTASVTKILLKNGAKAANIYWSVGTQATLGSASSFEGTILAGTAVVFNSGSVMNGRALAGTAVTFASGSAVTLPDSISPNTYSLPNEQQAAGSKNLRII